MLPLSSAEIVAVVFCDADVKKKPFDPRRVVHIYQQSFEWVAMCEGRVVTRGATRDEVEANALAAGYRVRALLKRREFQS